MKKIIALLAATFTIGNAHAAEVRSAKVNLEEKTVVINVRYGGGCGKHDFKLENQRGCMESYPVQCVYKLVHTTDDRCEALFQHSVTFTWEELGWNDSYFNGASIKILGAHDSSASVRLPFDPAR